MNYAETLDYLFTQLPMFQRQGAPAMKKDLTNIRRLLAWLGNPHEKLTCIHVAGTNGKGTVCHLIAAALQHQGYRVALYTSPHYKDFRERIKIDGQFIPEQAVVDFTARLRDAELGIEASFFEITVAMAFDYFARETPDFCVVEVGLGGRLDSTNIITPILSVITNIGLDHTQFLGETLPEIAGEKAGIIKDRTPVVIGRKQAETAPTFLALAGQHMADLTFAEDRYEWVNHGIHPHYPDHRLHRLSESEPLLNPSDFTRTAAQRENLITALVALEALEKLDRYVIHPSALREAWSQVPELTYYIGRFQQLSTADDNGPLLLADSAHNKDGLRYTIPWLLSYRQPLYIVLGMVSDKDHEKALRLFPKEATYYFVKSDIPRGLAATTLAEKARRLGLAGSVFPSVAEGYAAAREDARREHESNAVVFVGGSIFTVAEVI